MKKVKKIKYIKKVIDNNFSSKAGIVLSLDSRIQNIAEKALEKEAKEAKEAKAEKKAEEKKNEKKFE